MLVLERGLESASINPLQVQNNHILQRHDGTGSMERWLQNEARMNGWTGGGSEIMPQVSLASSQGGGSVRPPKIEPHRLYTPAIEGSIAIPTS
jgi:hypothetical protein